MNRYDVVQHGHEFIADESWCVTDTDKPGRCIPFLTERTALEVAINIKNGNDRWDHYLEHTS